MHTNVAGQDYGPVGFAARGNRLFALHQHQIISTAGSRGRRAVVRLPLAKAADPISTAPSRDERNTACGRAVSPRAAHSLSGRPWRFPVQARLSGVGFPPPLREHVLPPVSGDGSYACLRDLAGSQGLRAAFPLLPSWKRLAFPESRPVSLSRSTQNIIVFSPVCPSH